MDVLAERLAAAAHARGLTQQQLADAVGVARQAVSRWLNGKQAPEARYLARAAVALNVSADYLLGIDGQEVEPVHGPLDLAVAAGDDNWVWNGRSVAGDSRRRTRLVLHGLLAPVDQLPDLSTMEQESSVPNANAIRHRVEVVADVPATAPRHTPRRRNRFDDDDGEPDAVDASVPDMDARRG